MIPLPKQMLIEIFSNEDQFKDNIENIFKTNCSEGNCKLKGDLRDYAVLDGDVIKDCEGIDNVKSVDCILINKNSEGKINILLCELDRGSSGKSVTEVKKKMRGSGNHIFNLLNEKGFKINKLKCLYLGRYSFKPTKPSLTRVSIEGFSCHDITILNKGCGFTLEDSFFE